ncbi:hypothetical protein MSIMFI_04748 [Mycobacterium simulans]|nr:hypothetical protein MSIMFI_04748 [Mycobacterium simulans]
MVGLASLFSVVMWLKVNSELEMGLKKAQCYRGGEGGEGGAGGGG